MSTRYAEPYQFDHGAQDFTVRDEAFKKGGVNIHYLEKKLGL